MYDLRINIHGYNNLNVINEKEYPKFTNTSIRLKPEGGRLAYKNVRIVFEPSAVEPLFEYIAWGKKYRRGDVEQAGILIGNYYRDYSEQYEVIWADVVTVVPADPLLVNASFESINITASAWKKMYEDAEEYRTENLKIVGWYHTHLDQISTRFSGLDRNTQRKAFTYKYSFGVVLNPNQRKWSVFYGPESQECIGDIVFDEKLAVKYEKPKITIRQVNGDSILQEDGFVMHYDENTSARQKAMRPIEDNTLSFGELFGRFWGDVTQALTKARKGEKRHYTDLERHVNQDEPKIEIQSSKRVKCVYYSMSLENEFVPYPNFKCTIKNSFVGKILEYKQDNLENLLAGQSLWGYVQKSGLDMDLSLVESEIEANAMIIFSKCNNNEDIKEMVAMGIQMTDKINIEYIVLIDNENPKAISASVIHYSRGNII